ncbi:hypothetical protein FA09DRAFT_327379 [Tilletiopsis washingtonensis]|uniref:Uncharacterized protein n=1 Tax=Tilletiopsis washingtonensis TaxID=58919 RepID=A0A316ZGK6_9BASI|nr:hypothetical protein FA09DRAFT_327379 [Tilletiopsis washingtonensis]PWO00642.1 hypothetical protein FA09DRAFT_327379 [Tilletiopsis washingtonensis]
MALPPSRLSHTTLPQLPTMVRGAAKAQAQAKAAKNAPKEAKSTIPGRAAALKLTCHICRTPAPSYKTLVIHYEAKHPKETVPSEASLTS